MSGLYPLVDLIVSTLRGIRFYGISLYDAMIWTIYIHVMWFVVMYFFNAMKGSGDD